MGSVTRRAADTRSRLRETTLPALATALVMQISLATARPGFDLRALASAFGIVVLLAGALIGATAIALASAAAAAARALLATRVRFGPAPAVIVPVPVAPVIDESLLLDKRGRPLRGAARARRLATIERERAQVVQVVVAPPARRVIELPLWLDPRRRPALVALASRAAAAYRATIAFALAARRMVTAIVPGVPVPTMPVRWIRAVAITTTMTFVFATVIGTTGFIAQQGTIALGASTTLTIIAGNDVAARASDADDFRPIQDGALLRAGMTIRTGEASYAILTYFEGSTVSLEPGTTLVIEALEANPDGSTIISMRQVVGRTWHSVSKLLHASSRYEVRTPTMTAAVRGTAFEVGVEQNAAGEVLSSLSTVEGAVAASKPPTPAEPTPPEVVVPAGFQTTSTQAAPIAPPEPAPEPQRKVTVTVGTTNAVVVDPVGRANGEKDGKLVLQTPGAKVQKVDGKLVVTLPKVSDGKISTVIAPSAPETGAAARPAGVSVVTVVTEKGKDEARAEETVQVPATPDAAPAVTGIELKASTTDRPADVRVLAPSERQDAPAPKVVDAPKQQTRPAEGDQDKEKEKGKDQGESTPPSGPGTAKVSGVVAPIITATLPPLSSQDMDRRAEEARKAEAKAKEEAAKREEERRQENDRRAEEARRAEQKAKEDVAKIGDERRRAEDNVVRPTDRPAGSAPTQAPSILDTIRQVIAPSSDDSARRDAERKAEDLRAAEQKAKDEAARLEDARRKAEETKRQDDIKVAETARSEAERKAAELRAAEQKQKEDSTKDLQRVREIEQKAREQAQQLESAKRAEAEKRIDEFRKAEEQSRAEAARRLEEQRRAEEQAKADAERKLETLRQEQQRAQEEAARAAEQRRQEQAEQERQRSQERERSTAGFVPTITIDPLPGNLGRDRDRQRERSGR